jgi:hypothetical protein
MAQPSTAGWKAVAGAEAADTGGDPLENGEADDEQEEEEALVEKVGEDGEIEAGGDSLRGVGGGGPGGKEPDDAGEEAEEPEAARGGVDDRGRRNRLMRKGQGDRLLEY